ncbi:hypothetical protein MUP65_01905 [Patescibacteria group bacterium]|nr:hypothetical protein [Patescibacteria group bacterium]
MLGQLIERVLQDDEEDGDGREVKKPISFPKPRQPFKLAWQDVLFPVLLFALAIGVRIFYVYWSGPNRPGFDWYGDVYHHWQIAYLSKEIGFQQAFGRLWDLKGMEFFWGLGHPLALMIVFAVTGSVHILTTRFLSLICAGIWIFLLYFVLKRSFSRLLAVLVCLWASLMSVNIFSDGLGMQEPLGLGFLLGGILAWPRFGFAAGLLLAGASTVRSEYWIFAFVLIFLSLFDKRRGLSGEKVKLLAGYWLPIIFYMKYLDHWTGSPIFPVWWNYLASYKGDWFTNVNEPLTAVQVTGQWFGRGLVAIGAVGGLITLWKRGKEYLFFALGFLNLGFIGMVFGFGAYIHGFFDRFWVDRLLAFPYFFLGFLIIWFWGGWLAGKLKKGRAMMGIIAIVWTVLLIGASQLAWGQIRHYHLIAQKGDEMEEKRAAALASLLPANSTERILFLEDRPGLTYLFAVEHGIGGKRLVSQMYDPYFYAQPGEPIEETHEKMLVWIEAEKIGFLFQNNKTEYWQLIEAYPDKFSCLGEGYGIKVYEVL